MRSHSYAVANVFNLLTTILAYYYRPVETEGAGGGGGGRAAAPPPQIFAKVDLLPIENDGKKKKGAKKHKPYQSPQKLRVTLLLYM